ncbi:uncharacterized protein B0P05DRAFT_541504 [Gilbertella persicaria]|uniref:uncharacterized protein n=1 Tax=Gilbertella persicaria TaxID=101096 RepID=UPI00221EDA4F|nr:uncharacterized protein B0P05DRAFT_541504 [Gilbertella persicaria]KAI8079661.1 hypothetical protein B0P05DRAFT_541504 [Gilbertella persicaria]
MSIGKFMQMICASKFIYAIFQKCSDKVFMVQLTDSIANENTRLKHEVSEILAHHDSLVSSWTI